VWQYCRTHATFLSYRHSTASVLSALRFNIGVGSSKIFWIGVLFFVAAIFYKKKSQINQSNVHSPVQIFPHFRNGEASKMQAEKTVVTYSSTASNQATVPNSFFDQDLLVSPTPCDQYRCNSSHSGSSVMADHQAPSYSVAGRLSSSVPSSIGAATNTATSSTAAVTGIATIFQTSPTLEYSLPNSTLVSGADSSSAIISRLQPSQVAPGSNGQSSTSTSRVQECVPSESGLTFAGSTPLSTTLSGCDETPVTQLTSGGHAATLSGSDSTDDDNQSEVAANHSDVAAQGDSQNPNSGNNNVFAPITPVEWDGANPDAVMAQLKTIKEEAIVQYGLKSFYKSYMMWSKLKPDQKNKALAWFCKLPENIQC
jgi:hypothetical protein